MNDKIADSNLGPLVSEGTVVLSTTDFKNIFISICKHWSMELSVKGDEQPNQPICQANGMKSVNA